MLVPRADLTSDDLTSTDLTSDDLTSDDLTSDDLTSADLTSDDWTIAVGGDEVQGADGALERLEGVRVLLEDLAVGGGVQIHLESARVSGRHGVQYVAQCVACAALTLVVWQSTTNLSNTWRKRAINVMKPASTTWRERVRVKSER